MTENRFAQVKQTFQSTPKRGKTSSSKKQNQAMFDGSSIEGFVRINESDMYLYPDLQIFTVLLLPL